MPKRSAEEKMEYYSSKIRKLQEKSYNRRRRVMRFISDSSDSEHESDQDQVNDEGTTVENDTNDNVDNPILLPNEQQTPTAEAISTQDDVVPPIDSELLNDLGDAADDVPKYGPKIHPDLAQRWLPILRKGLEKENKDKLLKEYTIPENCKLLRAPSLNAEITAAVSDIARGRDQKIESSQQQLGVGISALNRAMTLLLTTEDKQSKVQAIKILSDGCRILTDLHFSESQARVKLVTPGLDKVFLNVIQDVERDETLFGSKLSEKIKASKTIEKQGLQIKKIAVTTAGSSTSQAATPAYTRYQGNWTRPARFQPARGRMRGGPPRSTPPAARKPTAPPAAHAPRTAAAYTKSRAAARQ